MYGKIELICNGRSGVQTAIRGGGINRRGLIGAKLRNEHLSLPAALLIQRAQIIIPAPILAVMRAGMADIEHQSIRNQLQALGGLLQHVFIKLIGHPLPGLLNGHPDQFIGFFIGGKFAGQHLC